MTARHTIQDLCANFHPEILSLLVMKIDPFGQDENKCSPPKH
jgi:hypothetical protein